MSNYTKTNVGNESRTELHEALSLTGAEVSINSLPAGAGVPFDYSLVIAPVVADLCTTPVALSAPPNSYQNNSQS